MSNSFSIYIRNILMSPLRSFVAAITFSAYLIYDVEG
jgi:hypothetical protein